MSTFSLSFANSFEVSFIRGFTAYACLPHKWIFSRDLFFQRIFAGTDSCSFVKCRYKKSIL